MGTPPQKILIKARRCHEEGRFHAAADLLLKAFREDPEDAEIARELGVVLIAAGDAQGGIGYLQRARAMAPQDPQTNAELILALYHQNRGQEAARTLVQALDAGTDPSYLALKVLHSQAK